MHVQPTGFVRIEQRAKGPVAYSQIRCGDHCDKAQHVDAIGPVHVQRVKGKWSPLRSRPASGVRTLSECEEALRERLTAYGKPVSDAGLTFRQAVALWLDNRENVEGRTRSTMRDYRGVADRDLLPEFGDTLLSDITEADVKAYREKLLRSDYSKRTVQKTLTLLGGIFKTAGVLNPAANVKKGTIKRGEVVFFQLDDVERVAQAASDDDGDLFRVMAGIGLRRGEMVALRHIDIDYEGRKVHVRRNFVEGQEKDPKSHEVRSVPLPDQVRDILAGRASFDGLVFPAWDGSHQNPDNLSKRFTKAKKDAGLDHPGTLENLRHTFATYAADRAPLPKVQKWLGHADIATTMHYVGVVEHADDADLLSRVAV